MLANAIIDTEFGGLHPMLFEHQGPWVARLACDPDRSAGLDLADAIHALAHLHGGSTGLIDNASLKARSGEERAFTVRAMDSWRCERKALSILTVAAGPLPSTPDDRADQERAAALVSAVAALGSSDRAGVTLGATAALIIEWHGWRGVIQRAATRFAATIPRCELPGIGEVLATVAGFIDTPALERAATFGARQLLNQHGALVTMLEDRARRRAGDGVRPPAP